MIDLPPFACRSQKLPPSDLEFNHDGSGRGRATTGADPAQRFASRKLTRTVRLRRVVAGAQRP
jgi:hypothetical protein